MKTLLVVGLWIAIAGLCVDAGVQAAPDATTLSIRGTLAGYDSTTRTVSVTTRSGTVRLTLVSATRIRQGRHEIDGSALEQLTGYRAVLRYSESAGSRVLQSIHVAEKSEVPQP
jgi:hypothetical protein